MGNIRIVLKSTLCWVYNDLWFGQILFSEKYERVSWVLHCPKIPRATFGCISNCSFKLLLITNTFRLLGCKGLLFLYTINWFNWLFYFAVIRVATRLSVFLMSEIRYNKLFDNSQRPIKPKWYWKSWVVHAFILSKISGLFWSVNDLA